MSDRGDIDATLAPELRPEVSAVVLDGEAVLYDEWTGRVHLLNPSGSVALQLLDGETTIGEIGAALAEATGADEIEVTGDVIAMTRMLAEVGVLVGFDPLPIQQSPP